MDIRKVGLASLMTIGLVSLTSAFSARAAYQGISGWQVISAEGGAIALATKKVLVATSDLQPAGIPNGGIIGLAGLIDFNSRGAAKALNVTINFVEYPPAGAGFNCVLSAPSDVSYNPTTGALTLTVASSDSCTTEKERSITETGNSITFQLYNLDPQFGRSRIVATGTTLVDAAGNTLLAATATGELSSSEFPNSNILGPNLISANGDTTDTDADDGSLGIAGKIDFNRHGGADSLNVTVSYQDDDQPPDNFVCTLTTPADVSYVLSEGVGKLTLAISSSDNCVFPNGSAPTGSITFNLYSVATESSSSTRITNVGASFVDTDGDTIFTNATGGLSN
jgi:hypothetical protein